MKDFNKKQPCERKKLFFFEQHVKSRLAEKYAVDDDLYGTTIINNIIYNEKSHIVALFKDYLILDDYSEFLKRYYAFRESGTRLPRFYDYYDTYSKIYPNYTHLYEGKFIYHNIQKKQKMIDLQERMEMESKMKRKKKNNDSDEVFSTDVYDSIINDRNNEDLEEIFNLNEKSLDFYDKVDEMIADIEKNDFTALTERNPYTNKNNNSNSNININCNKNNNNKNNTSNINNNSNIGPNVVLHPSSNHLSMKHKLLISSLLRTKEMNSNNITDRHPYLNNQNTNGNSKERRGYSNLSNHSNNSNSQSKYMNPLTERPMSKNKMHDNYVKAANSRQSNHTKMLSDYPKTIIFNSSINAMSISKRNKEPTGLQMPLTQRDHHSRQHNTHFESNEFTLTKQNEVKRELDSTRQRSHRSPLKSPPKCTNNFIYIINQNPKFTTHVSLINNNGTGNGSKSKGVKLNSGKSSNVQSQSKLLSSSKPTGTLPSSDNQSKSPYYIEKKSGKTRNANQFIHNNFMLKTARDNNPKELNLLRTSSQPSIPLKQPENFYTTKYQIKHHNIRPSSNSRKKSTSNNHDNKSGLSQRTDSLTKNITTTSAIKPGLKAIPIKSFSKVFNVNFSGANTDRENQTGY